MSVSEVKNMTFWDYTALISAHNRKQKSDTKGEPMTEAEYDEMIEDLRAWNLPDVKLD